MRKRGRRDRNHGEIRDTLRAFGVTVCDLGNVGGGVPDLLVGWKGLNFLLELKSEGGSLEGSQMQWFDRWRGQARVVRNVGQAMRLLGTTPLTAPRVISIDALRDLPAPLLMRNMGNWWLFLGVTPQGKVRWRSVGLFELGPILEDDWQLFEVAKIVRPGEVLEHLGLLVRAVLNSEAIE